MSAPILKVKKLHPDAKLPKYATDGSACFDVHAIAKNDDGSPGGAFVNPAFPFVFATGLSFEIPEGYVMLVFSRSGHAFNFDVRLSNCVAVIDSDYRGELRIRLTADGHNGLFVQDGDRIAQCMLIPIEQWEFAMVDELSETARGEGGFGSTGR